MTSFFTRGLHFTVDRARSRSRQRSRSLLLDTYKRACHLISNKHQLNRSSYLQASSNPNTNYLNKPIRIAIDMSLAENERDPPFRSDVRASGLGEVWTHSHDELKFTQFGWRSTTKESSYSNNTLIGNWNEEKFDINCQNKAKRLPSQVCIIHFKWCFHSKITLLN